MANRFTTLEQDLARACGTPLGRVHQGLVAQLQDASVTIDILWEAALAEGAEGLAIPLAEASQAVHRALVALTPPD